MAKLPVVKGDDAIKAFNRAGFYLDHWMEDMLFFIILMGVISVFLAGEKNSNQAPCEP